MRRDLNLDKPKRFTEKLQWLKLYKSTHKYWRYADKYEVRKYISNTIGKSYLIPLIGVYDSVDEIDFDKLPNQFVLKCTHDSGTTIICRDLKTLDINHTKKVLTRALGKNYFHKSCEVQYKNIKPRIVCEEFISQGNSEIPLDYKFFCFQGQPKYVQVDLNRFVEQERIIFDMDWNMAPFSIKFINSDKRIAVPSQFDKMKSIAKKLTKIFPFVRVDLYEINNKVYFGELTFIHGSGFERFYPDKYDVLIGNYIDLDSLNNSQA